MDRPDGDLERINGLLRRLDRERRSRLEAEAIGERTTRALFIKQKEIELLQAVAAAANEASAVEPILQKALDLICDHIGWPIGSAYLIESGTGRAVATGVWHLQDAKKFDAFRKLSESLQFGYGEGLPGRVIASGEAVWIADVSQDSNFPRANVAQALGIGGGLAFPILVGAEVAGVLEFFAKETGPPDRALLRIMTTCGAQLGRVIERLRAEQAIVTWARQAEAGSRVKSEFMANISHELRTPMNGVMAMTELVLDTDLTDEQRDYLSVVKSSSDALLALIDHILDFSTIDARNLSLDLIDFDLRDTVSDVMKIADPKALEKGLKLICQIHPGIPVRLVGDPAQLRRILLNLIENAIKFTRRGEVTLSIDDEPPATRDEHRIHFAVRDTGIGIPFEKQASIFEAFQQADGSMTRSYGGTGLGLTIAARLVELMHGRLSVESEIGIGSTFSFSAEFGRCRTVNS